MSNQRKIIHSITFKNYEFDADNITISKAVDSNGAVKFQSKSILYNKDGKEGGLYIKCHQMHTAYGIIQKEYDGKPSYLMVFKLNPKENEKDKQLVDILQAIEQKAITSTTKEVNSGKISSIAKKKSGKDYDAEEIENLFRAILVPDKDDSDSYIIYAKLKDYVYEKQGVSTPCKAEFTYPGGKKAIPWSKLMRQEFDIYPTLNPFRVFIGAQKIIQCSLVSGLIASDVTPAKAGEHNKEAAEEIANNNPELEKLLNAKFTAMDNDVGVLSDAKQSDWGDYSDKKTKKGKQPKKPTHSSDSSEEEEKPKRGKIQKKGKKHSSEEEEKPKRGKPQNKKPTKVQLEEEDSVNSDEEAMAGKKTGKYSESNSEE